MKIINTDPILAENTDLDNNRITELIQVSAFFKVFKLVITIFNVTIILAAIQYIYCLIVDYFK